MLIVMYRLYCRTLASDLGYPLPRHGAAASSEGALMLVGMRQWMTDCGVPVPVAADGVLWELEAQVKALSMNLAYQQVWVLTANVTDYLSCGGHQNM